MDFPTIKKPKAKDIEGAKIPKRSFLDTIETSKGSEVQGAKIPSTDSSEAAIKKSAESVADSAMKAIGSDKSSKAEMIRARAMLIKGKASKRKVDEDSMQAESSEDFDSYDKDRGYFKSKKK